MLDAPMNRAVGDGDVAGRFACGGVFNERVSWRGGAPSLSEPFQHLSREGEISGVAAPARPPRAAAAASAAPLAPDRVAKDR